MDSPGQSLESAPGVVYRRFVPSTRWGVRKEADIVYCALAFLFGVAWVQQLPHLPSLNWFAILFLVSIPLVLKWTRLLPVPFLLLGAAWTAHYAASLLHQAIPPELESKTITVTGTVVDLPQRRPHGVRILFQPGSAFHGNRSVELPRLVSLSLYQKYSDKRWEPTVGSVWTLRVRLKNPHSFHNPGGFNYEAYLFAHHIRATGYIIPTSDRRYVGEGTGQVFNRLRQRVRHKLEAVLGDSNQLGIIAALAIGDKQALSASQWKVLRNTGTSHLLAISGLHLSLVSGLVFLLARLTWGCLAYGARRLPAQRFAVFPALVSAFVYSGLAGFSIPTQRALVMLTSLYLSILLSRQPFRLYALAMALLAVLIYDPLAVLSPGFWLSFSAVAIIYFIVTRRPGTGYWKQGLRVQVGISVGLVPLSLLFFQSASLVSPLANLVAIPLYGLIVVPLTLLALASFALLPDPVGGGLLHVAAWLSEPGWNWIEWLGQFSLAAFRFAAPPILVVFVAMCGMALVAMPRGTPLRYIGLLLCVPVFWSAMPPPSGEFRATLLDVGQGLSLVVRTHRHTLVFDTGAKFSDRLNAGEAVVVPFLRQRGVSLIDTLIVSHDDNDHIGGLESVRAGMQINQLISNVSQALPTGACTRGRKWEWDRVQFEILHPGAGASGHNNNDSCVLLVRSSHSSLLVPGDIEKPAELELIRKYGNGLHVKYLVAPHHGSRTSSSPDFLAVVRPEWILVPAGHLNRYRHPSSKVTNRYNEAGIRWLVSGEQGAISVDTSRSSPEPQGYRKKHPRYWEDTRLRDP
ncbi:MAG: DNA internalization-related competence protein ComEC/Rec2 [Acidiferrobacterales bacterium]